jgi:hypothetical protein
VQRILTIVPGLLFLLAETIAGFDPPPSVSSAPSRERHRFAEDLSAMRELANESAQAAIKTFEKRSSFEQSLVNAAYLLIVLPLSDHKDGHTAAASYWPRPERVRLARFPAAAPLSRFTCS